MDVQELLAQAKDAMNVTRVYGKPFEKDGATIVPVLRCGAAEGAEAVETGPRVTAGPASV